jgi:hypothetical protein
VRGKSGEHLFEIIMRRHEVRSTMMTSSRPLEDWGKLIGDVPSATAILDRFLQHAEIVTITGKSYRLRNRKAGRKASSNADGESQTCTQPARSGIEPRSPLAGSKGSPALFVRRRIAVVGGTTCYGHQIGPPFWEAANPARERD